MFILVASLICCIVYYFYYVFSTAIYSRIIIESPSQRVWPTTIVCEKQAFTFSKIAKVGRRTTDTRWLNPKFFATQIQIPIPKTYLGFGYKGLVFCRNNRKHGQWSHSTKMGADKLAKNTPNLSAQAPKFGISMKKASSGVRSP